MNSPVPAHTLKADAAQTVSHPFPPIPQQEVPIARSRSAVPSRTVTATPPSTATPVAVIQGGAWSQPSSHLAHLLKLIESALDNHKAQDITIISLAGKASFADYMDIATGTSSRHVASMADEVANVLKPNLSYAVKIEGQQAAEWVCVDAGDVIIHLFQPIARQMYNLDKLWSFPAEAEA